MDYINHVVILYFTNIPQPVYYGYKLEIKTDLFMALINIFRNNQMSQFNVGK
jgi:hypothetical protein